MNLKFIALLPLCFSPLVSATEAEKELNLEYLPEIVHPIMDSGQSDATKALMTRAQDVVSKLNLRPEITPEMKQQGRELGSQGRELVNAALSEKRKKILTSMGMPEESQQRLYYFVSWSMPLEMLRSYALDAMWTGGTLVMRGFPKDMDLGDFVTKELPKVVGYKGATAAVSLDPRLFDAYKVSVVPATIYSEANELDLCLQEVQKTSEEGDVFWAGCGPVDESKYWKMSGAVTSDYALRAFIADGAEGASLHLDLLAKGGYLADGQARAPFDGDWDNIPSPEVLANMKESITANQEVYMTPYGSAIGPAGQANPEAGLIPIDKYLENKNK
jgi:type-F conjugative transfer system pilin assembly protein TrbC